MADLGNTMDTSNIKSFWSKPEGKTGLVILAAAVGALVLFSGPLGIALLSGVNNLAGLVVGLTGLAFKAAFMVVAGAIAFGTYLIVTNPKTHLLCAYGFKLAMRKLVGSIVERDPIGIMKIYIERFKKRFLMLKDHIEKLFGQITVCTDHIEKNKAEHDVAIRQAQQAQKLIASGRQDMQTQLRLNANQADRLDKSNLALEPLLKQMKMIYAVMNKLKDATDENIKDLTQEVRVKSEQRDNILQATSVINSARAILNGDADERELFDQANEFVANDYGQRLGVIESFLDDSKPFIDGLDLRSSANEAKALSQIEAWSKKADSILIGGNKLPMIEHFEIDSPPAIKQVAAGDSGDDYQKFFNKS